MKATLKADGTLVISAENELEAYALRQWCREQDGVRPDKILIEHFVPPTGEPINRTEALQHAAAMVRGRTPL